MKLVECVPNFSEGRRPEVIEAITAAIAGELDATLGRAGLTPEEVEIVCCTGGTARLPAVGDALAARFGRRRLDRDF